MRTLKRILRRPHIPRYLKWETEHVYVSGDLYFEALLSQISNAASFVWIETYILKDDEIGRKVLAALVAAVRRGIEVRLIVDGVGSQEWIRRKRAEYEKQGLAIRVYRPLRFAAFWQQLVGLRFSGVTRLLSHTNRRTHRKLALIDRKIAFVGSMNLCAEPVESVFGTNAWRDTAVAVTGRAVELLVRSVEDTWVRRRAEGKPRFTGLIRDNRTFIQRLRSHQRLLREIRRARHRIYITTAYFVPEQLLRRALRKAARRGVDVRIILPGTSDVPFLPWVSRLYYAKLQVAGVRVLEYQKNMIHAKTAIIDGSAWVGSSNLNSRSLYWDRELDVRVLQAKSLRVLLDQFALDEAKAAPYSRAVAGRFSIAGILGSLLSKLEKLF
ncbi:MAG: phosphatidylserine/phosphatidylglycerophosphate/cardiolipin synthase family protein [Deltaproteobacteria bacterium]|nr:phosphatidylserine/phosphatidylglycerophosphate/cardiolipin synthase family protein [Deltaproteobacteria bacterium]